MTDNTDLDFEDKIALVTGAASGIGRATAIEFARRGARVAVSDVDSVGGEETAKMITDLDREAMFIKADVSDPDDVSHLFDTIFQTWDHLDIAFNNAGIAGEQAPTADCSLENWRNTLSVNLDGVFYCLKKELEHMVERNSGAIVNMSSVAGRKGFPGLPAYVASKHGVLGLTKAAAVEYAKTGVRVNAICPGVVKTAMVDNVTGEDPEVERQYVAMQPIGRMGTPEEIAAAVAWLCSDEASFVDGEALTADGAMMAG